MKSSHHDDDYDLQNLLALDNYVYYLQGGKYWVKFEARKIEPTKHMPHGIKYSLTFHDKDNNRIVGYDNAHDCLPRRKNHRAKKIKWDHIHKKKRVYYYEFNSASQLIEDFWKTIENFL